MCRWMAWLGQDVLIDELLFKTQHGIVDQSLHSIQRLTDGDRLIVSEPFSDLPGVWHEIPAGTAVTVRPGGYLEDRPFHPVAVAAA